MRGGHVVLCGRGVERDELVEHCGRASKGRGGVVVVTGEAGIGKSQLVTDVADWAAAHGFEVRIGAASPFGGGPFDPVLAALGVTRDTDDPARLEILQLLDQPAATGRALFAPGVSGIQARVVDAIARLAATLAARQPLLLVVEDIHWASHSTFLALAALQAGAARERRLVIATTRPAIADEPARGIGMVLDGGAAEIELAPLSATAVDELVTLLTGAPPAASLTRRVAETGGNPLFITELVRGLVAEGGIEIVDGRAEATVDTVPRGLAAQVLRKLDDLGHDARGVLRLGAVLGTRFRVDDLAAASSRAPAELMAPLDEVVRGGLLVDDGKRLAFRHDLVRTVIYEQIPQAVRHGVHRQVADALTAAGESTQRVAAHYAVAAEAGDVRAVDALHDAACELVLTAPNEALALFDRALELEPNGDRRTLLLKDRLEALALSGHVADAELSAAELVHLVSDPGQRAEVQLDHARLLLIANRPAEAATVLEELAANDPTRRELAFAEASLAALTAGDPARAEADVNASLAAGTPGAPTVGASLALSMRSRLVLHEFDYERSLELARAAVDAADRAGSLEAHRYQPLFFLGITLHDLDRLDETIKVADLARGVARRGGNTFALPLYDGLEAFAHLRAGRLAAAVEVASAGVAGCAATGSDLALAYCHALVALASLHTGDLAGASAAVTAGQRALSTAPPLLGLDLMLRASALLREADGDADGALASLTQAADLFAALGLPHMAAAFGPDVVRLAVASGELDRAEHAVQALEAAAAKVPLASWEGAALASRGLLGGDTDRLCRAISIYEQSPLRLAAARAQEQAGVMLCQHGGLDRGAALLRQAIHTYEHCGALRDRARAAAGMRAAGGKASPAPRTPRVDGELSRKEWEVAHLVSAGLSNPEIASRLFVSRRTIETHLRRIFAKLDLGSRVELALWATERSDRASPDQHV